MADRVTVEQRSKIMAAVGTRDTGPELLLRKTLHRLGYRYRTNYKKLPGKPDLAFPRLKKVIFVHGCFWHGHDCRWGRPSKSRVEYWGPKIVANRERDQRNIRGVRNAGWKPLVVWQCELRNIARILPKILRFLGDLPKSSVEARRKIVTRPSD